MCILHHLIHKFQHFQVPVPAPVTKADPLPPVTKADPSPPEQPQLGAKEIADLEKELELDLENLDVNDDVCSKY